MLGKGRPSLAACEGGNSVGIEHDKQHEKHNVPGLHRQPMGD